MSIDQKRDWLVNWKYWAYRPEAVRMISKASDNTIETLYEILSEEM